MGSQEQQFYTPENSSERYPSTPSNAYYQTPANVNVDLREQQQQEMYGGPEYYTGRGEKLQPNPPRRKRSRALWLVPIVLFFLIGAIGFGVGSHDRSNKSFDSSIHEQTFNVGVTTPTLVIKDNAGSIHIRTDEDTSSAGTVTVRIDKSGRSGSNPSVIFDSAKDIITVTANAQSFGDNDVNIDITTPKTSNVQLTDGNGDINLEGVTGTTNAQTTKGSIHADHMSGQVTLSTTDGDVSLDNGSLSNGSSLQTVSGDIHYNGSLDAQGSYNFNTVDGDVNVGLPSNSVFHLDAKSTTGHFDNEFGSDDVGSGTRPHVTISSVNGSIQVSKNG